MAREKEKNEWREKTKLSRREARGREMHIIIHLYLVMLGKYTCIQEAQLDFDANIKVTRGAQGQPE